eukprot:gnl/TRDRNA2_/TRDRNA2_174937_c1_seq1.p2 gnl/TRDRNA2_/TRDRNA2_174937_c1~~gnl/TRDRNA2_/TRDRNA2_174937_c1_seq1.p2  ORF type:complete len:117 (+),score=5.24 gnl/TRDRNA2_/TRDRNA2_174937_c1_seq1:76-426(+)
MLEHVLPEVALGCIPILASMRAARDVASEVTSANSGVFYLLVISAVATGFEHLRTRYISTVDPLHQRMQSFANAFWPQPRHSCYLREIGSDRSSRNHRTSSKAQSRCCRTIFQHSA